MKGLAMVAVVLSAGMAADAKSETLIPRSMPDKGKYYLLESTKNGSIVRALHKREGASSVGFTLTETNCKTRRMRDMGYSEESPKKIKINPTRWFELTPGSSKSDLGKFLCKW